MVLGVWSSTWALRLSKSQILEKMPLYSMSIHTTTNKKQKQISPFLKKSKAPILEVIFRHLEWEFLQKCQRVPIYPIWMLKSFLDLTKHKYVNPLRLCKKQIWGKFWCRNWRQTTKTFFFEKFQTKSKKTIYGDHLTI